MAKNDNKEKMKDLSSKMDNLIKNAPIPPMQERVQAVQNTTPKEVKEETQFSFYLENDLLFRTKKYALNNDLKVKKVISDALTEYLEKRTPM